MALSTGHRIGQYEIQAQVGAGGMGEVYAARDSVLQRIVAVKVLPPSLANDTSYMQRFQREAQVLASLNHPHIAAIYGLEQNAIIMELVEGVTLAERGAMPFEEAITIAKQIADALEYAHEKGVIHRDLKPGNVKITPDGVVKVLDFGLAKVAEPGAGSNSANSPTLTMRATEAGLILGTASYMAPEQAAGKPVDKRADIWAFGVVLWELLTGRRLFDGETVSHTLADVLRAPIDIDAAPESMRPLLRRCLERDPKKRLRDIGEARWLLENPIAPPATTATVRKGMPYWAAGLCLLPAAVLGWMKWREQPPAPAPVIRFRIDPPPEHRFSPTRNGPARVSPDGLRIFFLTGDGGQTKLWIQRLDATQAQPVAGADGAHYPFWSGDGQHIGFFADGKLKRVAIEGGPPQTICAAPAGRGGTWHGGADGTIVFAPNAVGPLSFVSVVNGEQTPATSLDSNRKDTSHRVPHFLPGGRQFLFIAYPESAADRGAVYVGEVPGSGSSPGTGKLLLNSVSEAIWAPGGYLLFVRERALLAQQFDAERLALTGEPVQLAENVATGANRHTAGFSATGGILTYRRQTTAGRSSRMAWLDRQGREVEQVPGGADLRPLQLSPDGKMAIASKVLDLSFGFSPDLWLLDLARGNSSRFTFDPKPEIAPVWSPDGKRIAYVLSEATSGTGAQILVKSVTGLNEPEVIYKSSKSLVLSDWTRDGKWLLFVEWHPSARTSDLYALPMTGEQKPVRLVPPGFYYTIPRLSPNGRYFASGVFDMDRGELFVRTFAPEKPEAGGKWHIASGIPGPAVAAGYYDWRADGKELFYMNSQGRLNAVPVESGATFQAGAPTSLFEVKGRVIARADGQRFLAQVMGDIDDSAVENVVLNWKALLPARR